MNRLSTASENLKKTVRVRNWYILFFLLFVGFSFIFETTYRSNIKKLVKESQNIQQTRFGKNVEISLFKGKTLLWNLRGETVDFSDPERVIFKNFIGENKQENYSVFSKTAILNMKTNLISLLNGVTVKKFSKTGKLIETVKAKNAYIDLNTRKVWGTGRVIIKRGNRLITGYDYIYNIKEGSFIILHDVATTIIEE